MAAAASSALEAEHLSQLAPVTQAAAQTVWDYLVLNRAPLRRADAILVLGSDDTRVPEHAADLFLRGLAPLLILSGNVGDITRGRYGGRTEAAAFADICEARGVPRAVMLLEERSTNTGENVAMSLALLSSRSLHVRSFIIVQKPFMERRAFATALRQSGGAMTVANVQMASPPLSLAEYPDFKLGLGLHRVLSIACGDLQRIAVYPAQGFQIYQHVPQPVWDALRQLVRAGFSTHLISVAAPAAPASARSTSSTDPADFVGLGAASPPPPGPSALEERVAALESLARCVQRVDLRPPRSAAAALDPASDREARVEAAVLVHGLLGCALARVPDDYYERPLAWRSQLLGCTQGQLCKTILLETDGAVLGDPAGAPLLAQRLVAVVLPYNTRLRHEALAKLLASGVRMAAEGAAASGFTFGGVTPLGSLTPLFVVVARQAAREAYIWLGGGDPDLKLRVFTRQLLRPGGSGVSGHTPLVLDIAEQRDEGDAEGD